MATVVSLEGKRKAPGLEALLALCAEDMVRVDREILARMRSPVALIPELANHLVGAGGKRMRTLLTVAAARLCGHSADDEAKILASAKSAMVVKSGNMSLGVNLLAALTKRVAKTLDDSFDIEIFEMHHNKKIDAPSGTALMFGRAAAEGRGIDLATHSARGRDGETGARKAGDIGFASLRGGSVVGEHKVIFAGPAERIELVHRAEDRMIFARGALHAALWARGQKPGLYSMADVLGLKDF